MLDLDNNRNSPYLFLNRLNTETLKQILRDDFESEDSGTAEDDEFVTCVMEVIAQRETEMEKISQFNVDAGWKDFQENYQPEGEAVAPVYGETAPDGLNENNGRERQADLKTPRPRRAIRRILRIAVIAAIVASLCVAAASAFEVNIFKMVAQWTQNIFQFRSETSISSDAVYESGVFLEDDQTLKDLLTEENITQLVYPKWIPEGYAFVESKSFPDDDEPLFMAMYKSESSEKPITVSIIAHSEPEGGLIEKDAGDVDSYVRNDIEHYIMNNNGLLVSTWFTGNLECFIGGEVSEAEMKTMIDSIYEE